MADYSRAKAEYDVLERAEHMAKEKTVSKFHVGDRVRIYQLGGYGAHGQIGTVSDVEDNTEDFPYPYSVQFDRYIDHIGDSDVFTEDQLRPADIFAQADEDLSATQQAVDNVNHPSHYNRFPVEVIEITEQLDFNKGNAVKYILRAGHKAGVDELEDLSKAAWCVNRAIEKLKKERESNDD